MDSTKSHRWPIVVEGIPFLIPSLMVTVFFGFMGLKILLFLGILWTIFVALFFRNPSRRIPSIEQAILSPADGRIVQIDHCDENNFLNDKAIKVSIFMSLFDVHLNRAPISGKVLKVNHRPGKFFMANKDKASQFNEQNAILIENEERVKILLVQIAGILARRIVCYLKPGDLLRKGEIFGMIRFGSRVDLYIPTNVKLTVKLREYVKAGESIIGYIYEKEKTSD
jgi:phosphatidylserine decarboxylase